MPKRATSGQPLDLIPALVPVAKEHPMSSSTNILPFTGASSLSRRALLRAAAAVGVSGAALASLRGPGSGSVWAADPLKGQIDAALAEFVASGFPGVAVRVEQAGKTLYKGAAGLADVEQEVSLKVGDRHRIYSIAKAFTATVALQLVDEGVFSLDDTVTSWLDAPEVAKIPNIDQITIRQILNHTSGIYDFADDNDSSFWVDAFLGPDADWSKIWTMSELLAYADGANHAPYFAPGEGYFYSNTNYILVGLIVEKVTGNTYGDEIQTRILDPLGLKDTFFVTGAEMPERVVNPYQLVEGQALSVAQSNLSWAWTFGGMVSTLADLARFGEALYSGELLTADSFAEMFTLVPSNKPGKFEGLGIYKIGSASGELIGMDGTGPGSNSSMMRLESADLTVFVLTNLAGDGADPDPIRDEVFRLVLESTN